MSDGSRAFARIEASLPLSLRPVDAACAERLTEAFSREPTYRAVLDRAALFGEDSAERHPERAALLAILDRLESLESTVDRIAGRLGVAEERGGEWVEGETVVISGGGLGVLVPQPMDREQAVEIHLELGGPERAEMRALGRVASFVRPDGESLPVGRFHLGIAFEGIHEQDREALIRYAFRLQRAQLRSRTSH